MKERKSLQIAVFILGCIAVNFIGKVVATKLQLPIWFDSVGTAMAAYSLGPVCGALVGASVNLMYGAFDEGVYLYVFSSVAIGVALGIMGKYKWFKSAFGAFSAGMIAALVATIISVPINFICYGGLTGNVWGDGVASYFNETGLNSKVICCILGEFFVDLVDKLFSVFVVYFAVINYKRKRHILDRKNISLFMIAMIVIVSMEQPVMAKDIFHIKSDDGDVIEDNYYDSFIQTIYNSSNGIPGGEVNDIAQTRDGMLWIGTYGGLYQYDGTKFTFMSHFDSVRNANCLYTDEEGRLWIGTNDSGLSICANNEIVNIIDKDGGLPEDSVRSIIKSSAGYYYVGTTGAMCVIALADGIRVESVIDELSYVKNLTADNEDHVCAVTLNGELSLLMNKQIVQKLDDNGDGYKYSTVYFDKDGCLFAANTNHEIEKFVIENDRLKKVETLSCGVLNNINSMYMTIDNLLFMCADNGIGYIDYDGKFNFVKTNNFDSSIDNMLVDYQGNFWFSSSRLGLLELSESIADEIYAKVGIEENVVNTVTKWRNRFYVGTDAGLDIIDGDLQNQIEDTLSEMLDGLRIRCLMVDNNNHLWIATSGAGAYEIRPDNNVKVYDTSNGLIGDKARTFKQLSDGSIAVSTDSGISFIKNQNITGSIGIEDGMPNTKALSLLEYNGKLYAGTDGGGIVVIKDGKVIENIRRSDGLSSDVVLRIKEDKEKDGLYVITSNCLNFIDNKGNIRQIKEFVYYDNYDVIDGQDDNLWITSSAGIFIVDREDLLNGGTLDYELLDSKKGLRENLTANSWNYVDEDDTLYLCGDQGIISVNMNEYDNQKTSYRIMLENVAYDGNLISVDKEEDNIISRETVRVEFFPQVINYSTSDPYVSVWLEGFDADALVVPQSQLDTMAYTNLPFGKYVFHVAILDNKQEQIVEEISYSFIKEKEIQDNWWFAIYMIFVFAIIVVYLSWLIVGSQISKSLKIQKKEIENLKLKQDADTAKAAAEAKNRFLALMSHDIRTPINAILGMNEMILRDSKEQAIYDHAVDIKSACGTLLSLVNTILDYSKIEEGKMEIIPGKYETRSLVNNLVNGIITGANEKELEFKVDVEETLPSGLFGDDVRISEVVSNLLTNAVKYTEKGFVSLVIREQSRKDDMITLYFEVSDSGIGIRKEDQERMFESFERLDQERNRRIQGTGLGMAIVSNLLKLMNSKLQVESEYEKGSTFSFLLEQKIVNAEPIGDISNAAKITHNRKVENHIQAPNASILIVDDNSMNLKVVSGLLRINGIVPDTVTSGKAAIEHIRKKYYDIIFLDHMMPDMDGMETFEIIKKERLLADTTKVIVLTANAVTGARENYLSLGFDDYLPKPVEVNVLESKLRKYLPGALIEKNSVDKRKRKNYEAKSESKNSKEAGNASSLDKLKEFCPELNIEMGLKYCMDSEEFYNEVLKEYLNGDKSEQLDNLYNQKDMHDYLVMVHSMKSISMSIGAEAVAAMAKDIERELKEDNLAFVEEHHNAFVEAYKMLLSDIRKYFAEAEV